MVAHLSMCSTSRYCPDPSLVQSGAIKNARVILMNSTFRSIAARDSQKVFCDVGGSARLHPARELHDGCLVGELIVVQLEEQVRE